MRPVQRLFTTYRVLAYVVGVLLVILVTGWGLELLGTDGSSAHGAGETITRFVGILHGWLYMAYLVASFVLSRRLGWSLGFTLLVLAAGLVPILIFWVEHRVTQLVRAAHPELAARPEPVG